MGALDGLRVLDLGILVQGPLAAGMLADMGADVIKVELPEYGDQSRWIFHSPDDTLSGFFAACNRGKRAMTVNLRSSAGQEIIRRLATEMDVVISNFSVGTLDAWGLGFDDLRAINPRLIYAAGSVLGAQGPDASRRGADIAGQAMSGLISTTGRDGETPGPVGSTIADHMASQNMVAGVLAALLARERTGEGQRVDVSLVGSQIYVQACEYTTSFVTGVQARPANGSHPLVASVYGVVPTADGLIVFSGSPSKSRAALFADLGLPELADRPELMKRHVERRYRPEMMAAIREMTKTKTTAEWLNILAHHRVFEVRDYARASSDPQNMANGYFVEVDDPEWEPPVMVGTPIALSETPSEINSSLPALGQHTDEILTEFGHSPDEIRALREAKAI